MSGLERVTGWFESGQLVRPGSRPDLVDLARAVYRACGAPDVAGAPDCRLAEFLGRPEQLLLVLIDGLGVGQLARFPAGGFLRSCPATEIASVFPSTTAAALTSLATGEHPARHAVLAWWVHLPGRGLTATALPFIERFSEKPLGAWGVRPEELFPSPAVTNRLAHEPLAVLPRELIGTEYSTYSAGGTAQSGYTSIDEAFEVAARRVETSRRPGFTYLYLPQADGAAHELGCSAPQVLELFALYDRLLGCLAERLAGRARVLVTGDHGQVDAPARRTLFLDEGEALLDCLECPPSGERTVPFFHVRPGRAEEFCERFHTAYGRHFALLSADEAEGLELFGPGALCPAAHERLGDYLAVAPEPTTLNLRPRRGECPVHVGVHAGLTPAEMTMPLVAFG